MRWPFIVILHIENFLKFTGDGLAVACLHFNILPVGVMFARFFEQLFFGGEAGDDLLRCHTLQRGSFKRAFLSKQGQCRQQTNG